MSTMLAERLARRSSETESYLPEAIFGTAGSLGLDLQSAALPIRVGLWPLQSDELPELAMGLQSVLGYLLDDYQQIRVYHLLAKAESDPSHWNAAQSQFTPTEWSPEGLDNNVTGWGTLRHTDAAWSLKFTVISDEEQETFDCAGKDMASLVSQLATTVDEIGAFLQARELKSLGDMPAVTGLSEEALRTGLEQIFHWELTLYLHLLDQTWSQDRVESDLAALLDTLTPLADFGAWLAANAVEHFVLLTRWDTDAEYEPLIEAAINAFPASSLPTAILSDALAVSGAFDKAYDLLEPRVNSDRADELAYLALAIYYQRRGRFAESFDVFQDAIEDDAVSEDLYRRYGDLLVLMDYNRFPVDTFVLVDPDEIGEDLVLWEAIESYDAAITLSPGNIRLLNLLIVQLVDVGPDDPRLWERFGTLVELDTDNEQVGPLIDSFYILEDVTPGIVVLKAAVERDPEHVENYLNLAALYVVDEDPDRALDVLRKASALTGDDDIQAEIQRLSLLAEDPDFERRLGELTDISNAGNPLEVDDVEYLEAVLERVPTMAELYLLLAQAYNLWDDGSAAIEILLDGHAHLPDDPDVVAALGEVLWDAEEQDLAFSYLKKGLDDHPNHVPLLALAGQCLFEDGQREAAKAYLARAEAISPRHPALERARARIAGAI